MTFLHHRDGGEPQQYHPRIQSHRISLVLCHWHTAGAQSMSNEATNAENLKEQSTVHSRRALPRPSHRVTENVPPSQRVRNHSALSAQQQMPKRCTSKGQTPLRTPGRKAQASKRPACIDCPRLISASLILFSHGQPPLDLPPEQAGCSPEGTSRQQNNRCSPRQAQAALTATSSSSLFSNEKS